MSNETVTIETTKGTMTVTFYEDVAPKTVENFKKLAGEGFYNGTAFHRIMKGFMIQGGDPLTKDADKQHLWGTGDPGYKIDAEFNSKPHQKGVLSMARSAHPDSAGSQFFICLGDCAFLDGQYTAFGELESGVEVLEEIGETPCDYGAGGEKSKPAERIEVTKVSVG